jgi:hypothetical protein
MRESFGSVVTIRPAYTRRAVKEIRRTHFECLRGLGHAAAGKTILALLVFLHLLKRYADAVAKLGLRYA